MIGWATPDVVAALVARPVATVRRWAERGRIPSMRDPVTGRLLVDYLATETVARDAATRWDRRLSA